MIPSTLKKTLALTLALATSQSAFANYCAAIRGNGELMPAHWGAMSALVEEKGLPEAMAGGSSATITMFLLESVSLNPMLKTNSERALMIKSFQGYLEALTQTSEGKAILSLLADKASFQALLAEGANLKDSLLNGAGRALILKHLEEIKTIANSQELKDLINPEFIGYVMKTQKLASESTDNANMVTYRSSQVIQAIQNFGSFNAETDKTLFFRPGLISFKKLSQVLGRMANFYAGYNNDISSVGGKVQQHLSNFLRMCTPNSQNLTWNELINQRPQCRELLGAAVLTYLSAVPEGDKVKSRAKDLVGQNIATFASTSVLLNEAVADYTEQFLKYDTNTDPNFGTQFHVSQDNLRFGYWGLNNDLSKVENTLASGSIYASDEKSKKFLSLGEASWEKVLSLSPAEPGLGRILAISNTMLSAGGWSDLHPTLVLKAHGCQDIVYVTRKGNESKFAQNVFKRLTQADQGEWSALYDMNNSQSSIMRSQQMATQIKCTNWDSFNVKTQINELVADAMRSPSVNPPYCR